MATDLHLTPVQTARLGELVAEEFRAATPGMVAEMSTVYAARMSEAQLRETIGFLRSPSGAAFLQTQIDALQPFLASVGMSYQQFKTIAEGSGVSIYDEFGRMVLDSLQRFAAGGR